MSLQLTFNRFDDLELLEKALESLQNTAASQISTLAAQLDTNQPTPAGTCQNLAQTAVLGVHDAKRMLGRILLGILEDNPAYAAGRRPQRHQEITVVPTAILSQDLIIEEPRRQQFHQQ